MSLLSGIGGKIWPPTGMTTGKISSQKKGESYKNLRHFDFLKGSDYLPIAFLKASTVAARPSEKL